MDIPSVIRKSWRILQRPLGWQARAAAIFLRYGWYVDSVKSAISQKLDPTLPSDPPSRARRPPMPSHPSASFATAPSKIVASTLQRLKSLCGRLRTRALLSIDKLHALTADYSVPT